MSSMFDNYDEIIPNRHCPPKPDKGPLKPCRPDKPYESYNEYGELDGYWWYYGNNLNLEFIIEGEATFEGTNQFVEANDFVIGKSAKVIIYDFRRKPIKTLIFDNLQEARVIVPIDEDINHGELSKKMVPGVYYCSLTLFDDMGYNETILRLESCTLQVK